MSDALITHTSETANGGFLSSNPFGSQPEQNANAGGRGSSWLELLILYKDWTIQMQS